MEKVNRFEILDKIKIFLERAVTMALFFLY